MTALFDPDTFTEQLNRCVALEQIHSPEADVKIQFRGQGPLHLESLGSAPRRGAVALMAFLSSSPQCASVCWRSVLVVGG